MTLSSGPPVFRIIQMSWNLTRRGAKQSFEDRGIPKLELGNEVNEGNPSFRDAARLRSRLQPHHRAQ